MRRLVLICALFLTSAVFARDLPAPYDAQGRVEVLDQLIESYAGRYRLYPVDLFENRRVYEPKMNSTMLSDVRYIYQRPDEAAFARELEVVTKHANTNAVGEQTLFVHTSFEVPGRQHYRLEVSEPVMIPGRLFRASLWVRSSMYRDKLELLFETAEGKEVRVPAGDLLWHGWRRLDLTLPVSLQKMQRNVERRREHRFVGLLIRSHPKSKPGDVALSFDNLLIVSDLVDLRYPGGEYADTWK